MARFCKVSRRIRNRDEQGKQVRILHGTAAVCVSNRLIKEKLLGRKSVIGEI